MKRNLYLLLVLLMILCLTACGNGESAPEVSPAAVTEEPVEEETVEEVIPEVRYFVTVEDPDGYPVPGVTVELCDNRLCIKGETDENGKAEFTAGDVTCTVKVLDVPEEYVITDEIITIPEDEKEICITLEFASSYKNLAEFKDIFGNPIPETFRFETQDLNGNPVRLADVVAGHKVTMVNFWNTGCVPCIKEMPGLEQLNRKFEEQNCQVVGICTVGNWGDENEKVKDILEKKGVTYVSLLARELDDDLPSVDAVPVSYFVDSRGKVLTNPCIGAPENDVEEYYSEWMEFALSCLEESTDIGENGTS